MKLPKHAELWLPGFLADRLTRRPQAKRVWVAITDHYEPMGGNVSLDQGRARVRAWQDLWPAIASGAPQDAAGNTPRYTFFYPEEEYVPEIVRALEPMVRAGFADVEVHLHHDHDTASAMEARLRTFLRRLREDHGFLHTHRGQPVFGFIHGNWALDNSRPDGRWCGVQGELQLLRKLGCYADFTMPSLPSATQGGLINRIFWTNGDPGRPKGFNQAIAARPGAGPQGNGLLMIPGPMGLRFRDRLMPRLETGELAVYDAPTPYRVQRWLSLAPQLGEDIFIKLYGHTAREDNAGALLGAAGRPGTLASMFPAIAEACAARGLELHWASAYEMFARVDAIIQGSASQGSASA